MFVDVSLFVVCKHINNETPPNFLKGFLGFSLEVCVVLIHVVWWGFVSLVSRVTFLCVIYVVYLVDCVTFVVVGLCFCSYVCNICRLCNLFVLLYVCKPPTPSHSN